MPDLNKLPVPQYDPNHPYHWEYDNLPLKTLEERDEVINSVVDIHSKILKNSSGSTNDLSERLNESLNEDGSLKKDSIDSSLHNISDHVDNEKEIDTDELNSYIDLGFNDLTNPVSFVRMLEVERIKLSNISENATNINFSVETASNIILFEEGTVELIPSTEISWEVVSPNKVKANLNISLDFAHRHYYNQTPISTPSDDLIPVDYKLFKVTSMETPYIEGSLRVSINGVELNQSDSVYYPSNPIGEWTLNKYTEDFENGRFVLDEAITEQDIIKIHFDVLLN